MLEVTSLIEHPRQSHILPIGDLDAELLLEFRETQNAWFMTLTYQGRTVSNVRVTRTPNLLTQFKSSFPFGLAVDTSHGQDPLTLDAWVNGSTLYILAEAEVEQVEAAYYGL
jgi:hypothetical protein